MKTILRAKGQMKCLIMAVLLLLSSTVSAYTPALYNLQLVAGEDFTLELKFLDQSSAIVALTGYSFEAVAKSGASSVTPLAAFTVTVNPTNTITIRMPRAVTSTMKGKTGVWSIKATAPGGDVSYWVQGSINFKPL